MLQQQQKLQELQGQITQQYASTAMGPQGLPLFALPFLDQLHGLQAGHLPGVGKSPIPNHVSFLHHFSFVIFEYQKYSLIFVLLSSRCYRHKYPIG